MARVLELINSYAQVGVLTQRWTCCCAFVVARRALCSCQGALYVHAYVPHSRSSCAHSDGKPPLVCTCTSHACLKPCTTCHAYHPMLTMPRPYPTPALTPPVFRHGAQTSCGPSPTCGLCTRRRRHQRSFSCPMCGPWLWQLQRSTPLLGTCAPWHSSHPCWQLAWRGAAAAVGRARARPWGRSSANS